MELSNGIRLDTNYYYWPNSWVQNKPGFFTGSGIPMRFADATGALIDVYQATTQMNDEADQTYPFTVDALLSKAVGPEGYYGVFTTNMHTDFNPSDGSIGSDAIVASAQSRGVPVVSARQMLTWLDGRNGSSFQSPHLERQRADLQCGGRNRRERSAGDAADDRHRRRAERNYAERQSRVLHGADDQRAFSTRSSRWRQARIERLYQARQISAKAGEFTSGATEGRSGSVPPFLRLVS